MSWFLDIYVFCMDYLGSRFGCDFWLLRNLLEPLDSVESVGSLDSLNPRRGPFGRERHS